MLSPEQIAFYHQNGYLIIENFASEEEIQAMKQRIREIVQHQYDPEKNLSLFVSDYDEKNRISDHYFFDSSDKIGFFLNQNTVDLATRKLKCDKYTSLNKVAHSLHDKDSVFKDFSFSNKAYQITKQIFDSFPQEQCVDPRIVQSMYIFKHPKVGERVTAHQDATFLHAKQPHHLMGIWLALDNAYPGNGCLWGIPGSHKDGLATVWKRDDPQSNCPKMKFIPEENSKQIDYVNQESQYNDLFQPLIVPKGAILLIHGAIVHKSEHNSSNEPREIYTYHIMDFKEKDEYSKWNWLQRSDNFPAFWKQ